MFFKNLIHIVLVVCLIFSAPLQLLAASKIKSNQAPVESSEQVYQDYLKQYQSILDGNPEDQFYLDDFFLLPQKAYKKTKKVKNYDELIDEDVVRFVNWWDTQIEVSNFANESQGLLKTKDASGFQTNKEQVIKCQAGDCKFSIYSKTGEKLHEFTIPVKQIATYGPYLVFVRKHSYNKETKTQKVSFIDIKSFNHNIGNQDLPVFDIPFKMSEAAENIVVEDGLLKLNKSTYLNSEQLEGLSNIYKTVFNLTANMVSPKKMASTLPLLDSITTYLNKLKQDNPSRAILNEDDFVKKLEILQQLQKEELSAIAEKDKSNVALKGKLQSLGQYAEEGQKLSTKFKKLTAQLFSPQPDSSSRIENAIAFVMAKAQAMSFPKSPFLILQGLASRKMATTAMVASASLSLAFPQEASTLMLQGLDIGHNLLSNIGTSLLGVGEAFWRSFSDITSVITNGYSTVKNNLLSDGKWQKLLAGLGFLGVTLGGIVGAYHVAQNTYAVFKESRQKDWQGLVTRQQKIQKDYLDALAAEEAKKRNSKNTTFSIEDEQKIEQLIAEEKERSKSIFSKAQEKLQSWNFLRKKSLESSTNKVNSKKSSNEIKTFWQAFKHLYISFASYAKTILHYTGIWNYWSGIRYSTLRWGYVKKESLKLPYFRATPLLLGSRFLYPKMFKTIVENKVLPSAGNGGLDSLLKVFFSIPLETTAEENKKLKQAEESFQKEFLQLEQQILKKTLSPSLKALSQYSKNSKDLDQIFQGHGLVNITDKSIRELPPKSRFFIRAYSEMFSTEVFSIILTKKLKQFDAETIKQSLLEEVKLKAPNNFALHEKLSQVAESGEATETELQDLIQMLKAVKGFSKLDIDLSVTEEELYEAIKEAHSNKDFFALASSSAESFQKISSKVKHLKYEIASDFDPKQDDSMERYAVVQEKRKNPLAMARAVRAEVSKLLVTLPLDITTALLFTAGIVEGVMKPLQEEMFGPNSVMYLSQYSFYGSIATGVLMGLLANSWVKLQQDARHDDAGNFGNIPRGKDAEKSFLKWFWKQTNQRDNSLWNNWKHYIDIVWPNIPAFFTNMLVFNLIFIGFFDLDAWAAAIVTVFTLPTAAFTMKIEQGFEKAAYYDAKIFPEEYLSHPKVQEYIQKKSQMRRNKFNLLFDIFRNYTATVETNAFVTPTESHPNRAFSRAIFGTLLAEKIINSAQVASDATQDIPVVNKVTSGIQRACEAVLGHKDVIETKYPIK